MLKLTINAEGKTTNDLELAVEEALNRIKAGNTSGFDSNDDGDFNFSIEGEEESLERKVREFFESRGTFTLDKDELTLSNGEKATEIRSNGVETEEDFYNFDQLSQDDLEEIETIMENIEADDEKTSKRISD